MAKQVRTCPVDLKRCKEREREREQDVRHEMIGHVHAPHEVWLDRSPAGASQTAIKKSQSGVGLSR